MYQLFQKLLDLNGVTAYRVAKETGISTATLTQWKKGTSTPKPDKLQKIADYFNVPLSYFYGESEQQEEDFYYQDPEARAVAQAMYDNPDYKVLFKAARNVKAENLLKVAAMLEAMNKIDNQ